MTRLRPKCTIGHGHGKYCFWYQYWETNPNFICIALVKTYITKCLTCGIKNKCARRGSNQVKDKNVWCILSWPFPLHRYTVIVTRVVAADIVFSIKSQFVIYLFYFYTNAHRKSDRWSDCAKKSAYCVHKVPFKRSKLAFVAFFTPLYWVWLSLKPCHFVIRSKHLGEKLAAMKV